jgi:hypothetical protein
MLSNFIELVVKHNTLLELIYGLRGKEGTCIRKMSFEFSHLIAPYQILLRCDKIKSDKKVL